MSVVQEHESALRFCQRALQVDPTYAYAYTLCGHEYFANDDFQKGIDCYRHAIRLDPRHYQAWYAAGQHPCLPPVCLRVDKLAWQTLLISDQNVKCKHACA